MILEGQSRGLIASIRASIKLKPPF